MRTLALNGCMWCKVSMTCLRVGRPVYSSVKVNEKNKKSIINLSVAEFAQKARMVKQRHVLRKPRFKISILLSANVLTLVLLNPDMSCLCKQCRSALFATRYINLYQQPGLSNLIG